MPNTVPETMDITFCCFNSFILSFQREKSILPPSNGYRGSRLKRASAKEERNRDKVYGYVAGKNHHRDTSAGQSNRLTIGPAAATANSSPSAKPLSNDMVAPNGVRENPPTRYPRFRATR